jgi:hypothetical protein
VLGSSNDVRTRYVALRHEAPSLHGRDLKSGAANTPWGYVSSVSAGLLSGLPDSALQAIRKELIDISGGRDRIMLSNEGWINEYEIFEGSGLLPALGLNCTVVVYVRPPVEWLNSAWWQWGAWAGVSLDQWLNAHLAKVRWHDLIVPWKSLPGVERVIVRLLPSDVIADFCNVIGIPPIPGKRSNSGLPGTILRLYQRHRELRKSSHDSANDFVLSRHFGHIANDPTPWVIGPYKIKKIVESTRKSNTDLMNLLDADSRASMENDPRWWDAAAFADKKKSALSVENLPLARLEEIAVAALSSIRELEGENRSLRRRLNELSEKSKQENSGPDSRESGGSQ